MEKEMRSHTLYNAHIYVWGMFRFPYLVMNCMQVANIICLFHSLKHIGGI